MNYNFFVIPNLFAALNSWKGHPYYEGDNFYTLLHLSVGLAIKKTGLELQALHGIKD